MSHKLEFPYKKTTLNLQKATREKLTKICQLTGLTRREIMERALLKYFDEFYEG